LNTLTDPKEVVEKHINLLKKDGLLIITIPNYRGINWFILSLFNKKSLSIHNLNIMNKEKFLRLFENEKLHKLYSDYWGTFNFGLFSIPKGTLKYNILNRLKDFQLLLNLIFRLTFKDKEPKTWFLSPHLIYVGQKITD
jgi:hypothetical protein